MTRSFETLSRILEILADPDSSKLVVVHHNGDPDALGSALALQAVFPEVRIGAPLGLNNVAQRLLDAIGGTVLEKPRFDDFDYLVVVDTSSPVQLGAHAKDVREPIVIDHHAYHDAWADALYVYVDPSKASCCEVVYDLLEQAYTEGHTDFTLDGTCSDIPTLETVGIALLTGIWTDTGQFRHAHPSTFAAVAKLLSATGTSVTDILEILESEPEFHDGKRQAHFKAATRMRWDTIGPVSVAFSHVSAYEASAARALTLLGADVAFCVADTKGEIRASARARKKAVRDQGIHLGDLMNRVGKRLGFMGGGHDGAAGMNLPKAEAKARGVDVPDIETVLEALAEGLREDLAGRR